MCFPKVVAGFLLFLLSIFFFLFFFFPSLIYYCWIFQFTHDTAEDTKTEEHQDVKERVGHAWLGTGFHIFWFTGGDSGVLCGCLAGGVAGPGICAWSPSWAWSMLRMSSSFWSICTTCEGIREQKSHQMVANVSGIPRPKARKKPGREHQHLRTIQSFVQPAALDQMTLQSLRENGSRRTGRSLLAQGLNSTILSLCLFPGLMMMMHPANICPETLFHSLVYCECFFPSTSPSFTTLGCRTSCFPLLSWEMKQPPLPSHCK